MEVEIRANGFCKMLVFSLIVIIIILSKRVIVIIIALIKPGEMACLRFVCLFVVANVPQSQSQ